MCRTLLAVFAVALICMFMAGASADQLDVPLDIRHAVLVAALSDELGMDADGRSTLRQDGCNQTILSDLQIESRDEGLVASLNARTRVGTETFGRCVGPGEWHGRLLVTLVPAVSEGGLAVVFQPESTELRRPDGSESLFTRAAGFLADTLVVPRLQRLHVDLRGPLDSLDRLLGDLTARNGDGGLVSRARLADVAVTGSGVRAMLRLQVEPPSAPMTEPPLDDREYADWQRLEDELDGFLTVIVLYLAGRVDDPALQRDLLAVLLDSRHAISEALTTDVADDEPDPVRHLFMDSWDRLRPHVQTMHEADLLPNGDWRVAGFVAGGDAIRALDALGPEYGLEITRDGLRRLARLLLADEAPDRFTPLPLDIDPGLRRLFPPLREVTPDQGRAAFGFRPVLIRAARADDRLSPAEALRGRVPQLSDLDDYLELVSLLLAAEAQRRKGGGSRLPPVFRHMIDPMIRATAWKESCWRQYVGSPGNPRVITSPAGALGMMQINARVWRGLYDVDRLADDVAYNLAAGADILDYYFVDYALRREEHLQPGGINNLVRATYAAYNGGPGHLNRYRRDQVSASLRAIDRDFWHHYEVMRRDKWPDVASCYAVPGT